MPRTSVRKELIDWYIDQLTTELNRTTGEQFLKYIPRTLEAYVKLHDKYTKRLENTPANTEDTENDENVENNHQPAPSSISSSSSSSSSSSPSSSSCQSIIRTVLANEKFLDLIKSERYIAPRLPVPRTQDFYLNVVPNLDNDRFRQNFRVNPDAFAFILQKISTNPVFGDRQGSAELQLKIALRRFGGLDDVSQIAQKFGIGEGTVVLYTQRVAGALMELWSEYVRWPTVEEQAAMKARLRQKDFAVWEDCVGFIDGTMFPFATRPAFGKEDARNYYNMRKHAYGQHATVVCDDQNRITHFTSLFPGSVSDQRAFRVTDLFQKPEEFFKNQYQYLLGDKGYALNERLIIPFKQPRSGKPPKERRRFNWKLSSLRVKAEHTIGILKLRFRSLQRLPVRLVSQEKLSEALRWIGACVVLHNMLVDFRDEWEPTTEMLEEVLKEERERDEEYLGTIDGSVQVENPGLLARMSKDERRGHTRRLALMQRVMDEDEAFDEEMAMLVGSNAGKNARKRKRK